MPKSFAVVSIACAALLAACSSPNAPPSSAPPAASTAVSSAAAADAKPAVRKIVERFGTQMQKLSVLAPPPAVRAELPKVYGDVLAPALLAAWQADPDKAVGREGSSPWPQKIEIATIECAKPDHCRVTGTVDYITSNEAEHGGVFMRRGITLAVAHTAQGWRIASVQLAPPNR